MTVREDLQATIEGQLRSGHSVHDIVWLNVRPETDTGHNRALAEIMWEQGVLAGKAAEK